MNQCYCGHNKKNHYPNDFCNLCFYDRELEAKEKCLQYSSLNASEPKENLTPLGNIGEALSKLTSKLYKELLGTGLMTTEKWNDEIVPKLRDLRLVIDASQNESEGNDINKDPEAQAQTLERIAREIRHASQSEGKKCCLCTSNLPFKKPMPGECECDCHASHPTRPQNTEEIVGKREEDHKESVQPPQECCEWKPKWNDEFEKFYCANCHSAEGYGSHQKEVCCDVAKGTPYEHTHKEVSGTAVGHSKKEELYCVHGPGCLRSEICKKDEREENKPIIYSNYCIKCSERARYIYKGGSLCLKHFEELE